jgi:hypothetical protein
MENLKQLLKSGRVVVFDNEATFTDDFRSAECSFRDGQMVLKLSLMESLLFLQLDLILLKESLNS